MSDPPDRPTPGPDVLVLRAVFVPEGQQPPPEFASVWNPLRIPATVDPATGQITCDNAGTNFGGDILAEWHPNPTPDAGGDKTPENEDTDQGR